MAAMFTVVPAGTLMTRTPLDCRLAASSWLTVVIENMKPLPSENVWVVPPPLPVEVDTPPLVKVCKARTAAGNASAMSSTAIARTINLCRLFVSNSPCTMDVRVQGEKDRREV